jgi:hypothetical protein
MTENSKPFTPTISGLKNQGVDVQVWKTERVTEKDPDSGQDNIVYHRLEEKRLLNIRFTNAIMSDLELEFGSMDNWQQEIGKRPYSVVLSTIVTVSGKPRAQVSEMLDSSTNDEYQVALLLAWMMAMGANPANLGKMMGVAEKLGQAREAMMGQILQRADSLDLDVSFPGLNSLNSGSPADEASNPSGDIPQDKPTSSSTTSTPAPKDKGKRVKTIPSI